MENFGIKIEDFKDLIKNWYVVEERRVKQVERYILTKYLKRPYRLFNTMIYKLYGEETISHSTME